MSETEETSCNMFRTTLRCANNDVDARSGYVSEEEEVLVGYGLSKSSNHCFKNTFAEVPVKPIVLSGASDTRQLKAVRSECGFVTHSEDDDESEIETYDLACETEDDDEIGSAVMKFSHLDLPNLARQSRDTYSYSGTTTPISAPPPHHVNRTISPQSTGQESRRRLAMVEDEISSCWVMKKEEQPSFRPFPVGLINAALRYCELVFTLLSWKEVGIRQNLILCRSASRDARVANTVHAAYLHNLESTIFEHLRVNPIGYDQLNREVRSLI